MEQLITVCLIMSFLQTMLTSLFFKHRLDNFSSEQEILHDYS